MEPSTGWFLENAWLIPVIPGAAFFVIILFGKRLPMKGSEVGIASMAASLVLAIGTAWQWIQRTDSVTGQGGEAGPLRILSGFARSIAASENGAAEPFVEPVIRRGRGGRAADVEFGVGQHIDGLAVMALFLVAFISLLVQIYSVEYVRGRPPIHPLLRRHHAVLRRHARDGPRREHGPADPRLGDHGPLLVHAHRPLVGGVPERPRRPQGVLHGARRRRRTARRHLHPVLRRQPVGTGQPGHQRLQHPSHLRLGAVGRGQPHGHPLGRHCPVHRGDRKERSVPAAHLAP